MRRDRFKSARFVPLHGEGRNRSRRAGTRSNGDEPNPASILGYAELRPRRFDRTHVVVTFARPFRACRPFLISLALAAVVGAGCSSSSSGAAGGPCGPLQTCCFSLTDQAGAGPLPRFRRTRPASRKPRSTPAMRCSTNTSHRGSALASARAASRAEARRPGVQVARRPVVPQELALRVAAAAVHRAPEARAAAAVCRAGVAARVRRELVDRPAPEAARVRVEAAVDPAAAAAQVVAVGPPCAAERRARASRSQVRSRSNSPLVAPNNRCGLDLTPASGPFPVPAGCVEGRRSGQARLVVSRPQRSHSGARLLPAGRQVWRGDRSSQHHGFRDPNRLGELRLSARSGFRRFTGRAVELHALAARSSTVATRGAGS